MLRVELEECSEMQSCLMISPSEVEKTRKMWGRRRLGGLVITTLASGTCVFGRASRRDKLLLEVGKTADAVHGGAVGPRVYFASAADTKEKKCDNNTRVNRVIAMRKSQVWIVSVRHDPLGLA